MEIDRSLLIFLPHEAAKDDATALAKTVFIGDGYAIAGESNRTRGVVEQLKFFEETGNRKARRSPMDRELPAWFQAFLADAEHFMPSEAGDDWLGMTSLVHPTGARLHEEVTASCDILFKRRGL